MPATQAISAFVGLSLCAGVAAEHGRALVLLNWAEYLDPQLVAEFEEQFDAQLQEIYYESDDLMDAILLETEGQGYDLAMVSGIRLEGYRKRGWLAPIEEEQIPNLRYVEPRWRDAFAGTRSHAVPYFWGIVGIAYRSDKVVAAPTSWMDLFRPAPYLSGRIAMIESMRDLVGMALKALGHSVNSADPTAIAAAGALLMGQKPSVKTYSYPALDEHSAMVDGEVWMAMMYNGDAMMIRQHEPRIEFMVPLEGSSLWVDYLAVLSASRHKELAWAFINFINEPENAARLARYVHYPTLNTAARKLLPADFLANRTINPSERSLANSEFYGVLAPRAAKAAQTVFARAVK